MRRDLSSSSLLIFVFTCLVSCTGQAPFETKSYDDQLDKSRTYRNIRIPLELRDILLAGSMEAKEEAKKEAKKKDEETKKEESHAESKEGKEGEEVKAPPPPPDAEFDRAMLTVYLNEKSPALLKGRSTQLDYKSGGGELDLAEFISSKHRGTFYIAMKPSFEEDLPYEVYFLSNSKVRKIGDETVGSGCDTFFKITSYFNKQMKGDGFAVNTTDQRHVSALQGVYFFIFKKESGRVGLAYLDVKDSRFPELRCRL